MSFRSYLIGSSKRFAIINWTACVANMIAGSLVPWLYFLYPTLVVGMFLGRWVHVADARDAELRERWRAADEAYERASTTTLVKKES